MVVGRVDRRDRAKRGRLRCRHAALENTGEGVAHIARGQGPSIVKAYSLAQVEDTGPRIGDFPAFRKRRAWLETLIQFHQRIEQQLVDPLRLSVGLNTRIEGRGTALDQKDDRVGIEVLPASTER